MDDSKPTNPKDRAATHRLDLTLWPDTATAYGALAFTEGDCKYGGFNWRPAGVSASVYVAACRRHLSKWYNGEESDPKTKVPHLANALACIAVIIDSYVHGSLNDDRPPATDVAKLLAEFEDKVKHLHEMFPNGPKRYVNKDTVSDRKYFTMASDNTRFGYVHKEINNKGYAAGELFPGSPELIKGELI